MANKRENFPKAMINDSYDYAIEAYDDEKTTFDEISSVEDSKSSYEQYTTAIGPGEMDETEEGTEISDKGAIEGFTVHCANKKFTLKFPLSSESIDDNRKIDNFLKAWAQGLGESARTTKEKQHANLFNYGGFTAGHSTFLNDVNNVLTTSYGNKCYDTLPFFNLSNNLRTAKHGGTYYNGVQTLNLNETNLQELYKLMAVTNAYNEAGVKVSIIPNILLVQQGSLNAFTAEKILNSPGSPDATHSGVANIWRTRLRLVTWPYLTTANAWFLGVAKKGIKSLSRKALTVDYYEKPEIDTNYVRGIIRFGRAVTNFRYWVGANFATS